LEEDRSRERAMLGSKMERLDRQFLKVEREARKEISEKQRMRGRVRGEEDGDADN